MEKRYVFRGHAIGIAGRISKPEDSIIWVQGTSSLPVIGGYARSHVERARFGDILSFESVVTRTTGEHSQKEKAYKTVANSVVKDLHINGRLSVDTLEATLISTHPDKGGVPSIVPTGTHITNLRIDGYPVHITLDIDLFTKYATAESLARAYASDDAFFKQHGKRFLAREKTKHAKNNRQIPESGGYIVCSIVSEVRTEHPKVVVDGHVLILKGFGRIFLGEILITGASRRLTLLRLKLGSPVEGDIACCEVEDNGGVIL
jgi:hypothetical protein